MPFEIRLFFYENRLKKQKHSCENLNKARNHLMFSLFAAMNAKSNRNHFHNIFDILNRTSDIIFLFRTER